MEINSFITNYNNLSAQEKKSGILEILKSEDYLNALYAQKDSCDVRVCMRIFADMSNRAQEFIIQNRDSFLELLKHEDPKVRMHTAQIIGNNCPKDNLEDLISAILCEQTMFTLPSYILAIGNAKNTRAKNFLENWKVRSDLDKHIDEENAALHKALANFVVQKKANVRILPTDIILLTTPNMNVTYTALTKAGYQPKKYGKYIAVTGVEDYYDLLKQRTFLNAYILLGKCKTQDLATFLHSKEKAIYTRTGVKNFRIEVLSVMHQVRLDIIKQCVSNLNTLINTPSAYSMEIVFDIDDDEAVVLLNPLVDKRFAYRKKAISASINPGVAACICAYASPYFDEDARVLDNFCGSGTMLFERGHYPHHTLTGADININAVEAAEENNKFSNIKAQFHHIDALKFTNKRYDEIISNMPFGLRVGSHGQNEKLYKAYFSLLPSILTEKGVVILFTHEKKLTEGLIKAGNYNLLKRATFDAGGLYPAVYIFKLA